MAKRNAIKTVRTFCTSNVGANEDTKTLWIFGAGASQHLNDFPMSFNFFDKSIALCTSKMKTFSRKNDPKYMGLCLGKTSNSPQVPSINQIRSFKRDSRLALSYIDIWGDLAPDHDVMAKIQYLWNSWKRLPTLLEEIGLSLTPDQLISKYPEQLIAEVRNITPLSLVKHHGFYDRTFARRKLDETLETLQDIYFYTLSEYNQAAHTNFANNNLYSKLVESFILEKNARVISFNYDTMLDEAIFNYFTRSWHYGGMTVAGINGYPVSRGAKSDLVLIKPHGSLHFLICPNCKRAHVNWFWTYRKTGIGVFASDNRRCVKCKKAMPGRKELLESMIVSPLYDKKIIKRSHHAIKAAFSWCDNIVAIGYSFPEQDTYFFECIKKGVQSRNGRQIKVRIVSENHDSAKKIKKRLDNQLRIRGIMAKDIKVKAEILNGFKDVKAGLEDIPA